MRHNLIFLMLFGLMVSMGCSDQTQQSPAPKPTINKPEVKPTGPPQLPESSSEIPAYFREHVPKKPEELAAYTAKLRKKLYNAALETIGTANSDDVVPALTKVYDRFGRIFIEIGLHRQKMDRTEASAFDELMTKMAIRYNAHVSLTKLSEKVYAFPKNSQARKLGKSILVMVSWCILTNLERDKEAMAFFKIEIPKAKGHIDCGVLLPKSEIEETCGKTLNPMDNRREGGAGLTMCNRTFPSGPGGAGVHLAIRDRGSQSEAQRWARTSWKKNSGDDPTYQELTGLGDKAIQFTEPDEIWSIVFLKGQYDIRLQTHNTCSFEDLRKLADGILSRL